MGFTTRGKSASIPVRRQQTDLARPQAPRTVGTLEVAHRLNRLRRIEPRRAGALPLGAAPNTVEEHRELRQQPPVLVGDLAAEQRSVEERRVGVQEGLGTAVAERGAKEGALSLPVKNYSH